MSEASGGPREDEDALDARIRAMTGQELALRSTVQPAPGPAFFDEDASIGKLADDASFQPSLPAPAASPRPLAQPPQATPRKTMPKRASDNEIWDDMSNLG